MNRREIKRALKLELNSGNETLSLSDDKDGIIAARFLGSYLSLDPCGRYHHMLSPNGITNRCQRFWENMEESAEELGAWIESGQCDSLDIFLSWYVTDVESHTITIDNIQDTIYVSPDGTIYTEHHTGELIEYTDFTDYLDSVA
jgi:hypothetical protein